MSTRRKNQLELNINAPLPDLSATRGINSAATGQYDKAANKRRTS